MRGRWKIVIALPLARALPGARAAEPGIAVPAALDHLVCSCLLASSQGVF